MKEFHFSWVPKFIRRDFLRKLSAVGFAAMVTALVYFDIGQTEETAIKISQIKPLLELRPGYSWRERPTQTVAVTVKAPRKVLEELKPEHFELKQTIGEDEYKTNHVKLNLKNITCRYKDAGRVTILMVEPETIMLGLDKSIEQTMKVNVSYDPKDLPPGFFVSQENICNTEVKVCGPESVIKDLERLTTERVSLHNQVASFRTVATLKKVEGLQFDRDTVPVEFHIDRYAKRQVNMPIRVMLAPGDSSKYDVLLSRPNADVELSGEKEELFNRLSLSEIHPFVDLTGKIPGRYTEIRIRCAIDHPGISVVRVLDENITVTLTEKKWGIVNK